MPDDGTRRPCRRVSSFAMAVQRKRGMAGLATLLTYSGRTISSISKQTGRDGDAVTQGRTNTMNHHRSSRRLVWALTLFSFSLWGSAANAAQTVLTYFSERGDYIGGEHQASTGLADGRTNESLTFGNSLDVSFNTPTFS